MADPSFHTLHHIEELRSLRQAWREAGLRVGFVPTMGYLHSGHLSLIQAARQRADRVVVSLFVNPTQFGPGEDLDQYPRDLDGDRDKIIAAGAHALFAPTTAAMYPDGAQTIVRVEHLTADLCGTSRPTHFQGVTTIVIKLFHLVEPHVAVFGQKDFQQLAVIRQLVRDLFMDIEIVGGPTIREADGLAMSSRNAYLSPEQRHAATCLSRAIGRVRALFAGGERSAQVLLDEAAALIEQTPHASVDYMALRDPVALQQVTRPVAADDRLFLAVHVGDTRLIDNAPCGGDDPFVHTAQPP